MVTTSTVRIFPKGSSPYDGLDMSGNVWEWCLTKWRDDYTGEPDNGAEGDVLRVVRGGSWFNEARDARCPVRYGHDPYLVDYAQGMRVFCAPLLF